MASAPPSIRLLPKEETLFLPDLFKVVQKAPDRLTRRMMLVEYVNKDTNHYNLLKTFAELAWHPVIEWELPDGEPPYAASTAHNGQAPNNLFRVFREASRFLKGGGGFIENVIRREQYFIQILEGLSADEARIMLALKDGTIENLYSTITVDLICETFPDWLPPEIVAANPPRTESAAVQPKKSSGRPKKESTDSTKG